MFNKLLQDHAARQKLLQVVTGMTAISIVLDKLAPPVLAAAAVMVLAVATGLLLVVWVERSRRGLD